jgi:hypothetical protein
VAGFLVAAAWIVAVPVVSLPRWALLLSALPLFGGFVAVEVASVVARQSLLAASIATYAVSPSSLATASATPPDMSTEPSGSNWARAPAAVPIPMAPSAPRAPSDCRTDRRFDVDCCDGMRPPVFHVYI